MDKQRWSRKEVINGKPPISLWPKVLDTQIDECFRESFQNQCKAVEMYLDQYSLKDIEKATGVKCKSVQLLTQKCLDIANDGNVYGYRALIPYIRKKEYERTAEVKEKFQEAQGGQSGLFRNVLQKYPKIKQGMDQLINKINSAKYNVHEKKIRPRDLHAFFLASLKKVGVQENEWPFNTKHLGLRTIEKYMVDLLNENYSKSVKNLDESDAAAHMAVGTGHEKFLTFEEPYDAVQLDAYSINAFFSAEFETVEGTTVHVQLDRLWLIALIEQISSAILSYSIVYRSEVGADDVLGVIRKALNPASPIPLTIHGLKYPENMGFPHEVFPQCKGALWSAMLLDGALVHLSNAVRERARNELGFIINWGPVGHFERRPNIERYFKKISDDVFMRYPSTTGSNPGNGRAKNAEENAVIYRLLADEAEQLIAVYTAQHNGTPNEGTSYNSPLQVLNYYINDKSNHFLLRHLPAKLGSNSIIIPLRKECIIRGGRRSGRRPYVEIDGARYTNSVLAQCSALVGQKLIVEINEEDMRFVNAYLNNGAELGFLKAGSRWGLTKHSRKTRKIINSLITKKILVLSKFDDPIQIYMNYLSTQNKSKSKKQKPILPSNATEATRVSKESGLPKIMLPDFSKLPSASTLAKYDDTKPSLMNKPMPDIAKVLKDKR